MTLEHKGFKEVSAANVMEAQGLITTESFDVRITDFHIPNPGDGVAVITTMRPSSQRHSLCMVTAYSDEKSAWTPPLRKRRKSL